MESSQAAKRPICSPKQAWRNVTILTALFCLLFALPNFVLLPSLLPPSLDVLSVALWMSLGFTVSGVLLWVIMRWWLRHDGMTLADLGWGRPTNVTGMLLALLVGAGWLAFSFWSLSFRLPGVDVTQISPARILAGLGVGFAGGVVEELALRGLVMEWLRQAKVGTWAQVLVSGAVFAIYHSLHNAFGFPFSMFISCLWAVVYVVGRRSLTTSIISHGLVDLLGEPFLLMLVVASR